MGIKELIGERKIPALLVMNSGEAVTTPEQFEKRKAEIRHILSEREYGVIPPRPDHMSVEILKEDKSCCRSTAVMRTLKITCEIGDDAFSFPAHSIIPKREGKHPAFVSLNFYPEMPNKYQPIEEIIDRGYALFTVCYTGVTTDDNDFTNNAAPILCPSRRRNNSSSKVAMWAWAAMRMMDYVETLPEIDKDNVAVIGHSRLGKTALVAGGFDERFKYVISNESGCAGAAISRGKVGEDIPTISRVFPFWFCPWYNSHAGESEKFDFDQHFLLALTVPRHLLVGSAILDQWADPTSEFLGLVAVNEAYNLYGMRGLVHEDKVPAPTTWLGEGDSCYFIREDAHYLSRHDWNAYMDFIDKYVK